MQILEKILSKLESSTDLFHARLVCHQWRRVLDELVGYSMSVTGVYSALKDLPLQEELEKLTSKSTISLADHCHMSIRHLTIGLPGNLMDNLSKQIKTEFGILFSYPPPHLQFPHILKSLSCYEPVWLWKDFLSVLSTVTTLKTLELSLFALSSFDYNPSSQTDYRSLVLPSLSKLVIEDRPPNFPSFDSLSVVPQLNRLLDYIFAPRLKNLAISYPTLNLLDVNKDSTRHLMKFISKSSQSLKHLSIGVISPYQNYHAPTKDFQYSLELEEEMQALGRKLSLFSASLHDNHLHSLRPSSQVKAWAAFLKDQTNLSFLKFSLKSSIELKSDVIPIIQQSRATLKSLSLACYPCEISAATGDISFVSVDGSDLFNCTNLSYFQISDKLANTEKLPATITEIHVDAMLTNNDTKNILLSKSMTCLEFIELRDSRGSLPKGFGYGVKIATLIEFVHVRKVSRLRIHSGCIDDYYPVHGISNCDPVEPKLLRKMYPPAASLADISHLSSTEFEEYLDLEQLRISWVKNERGYYVDDRVNYGMNEAEPEPQSQEAEASSILDEATTAAEQLVDNPRSASGINHSQFSTRSLMSSFQ